MVRLSRRAVIAGGAAAFAVGSRRAPAQEARFFRIATGPTKSGYFAIGSLIGSVVSSPPGARECERGGSCGVPGLIAVTQTTTGAVANIEALRAHRAESALCQADIAYWAFHGTGIFRRQGAAQNLRAIASLYRVALHVVVRRDTIRDFRQLRGKAVSLGERDSATLASVRAILPMLGIAERDIKPQFLERAAAMQALQAGRIDAVFDMAGLPSPTVADMAATADIALLPIDAAISARIRATAPFFAAATIPSGTYRGVPETPTVSVGVVWLVDAEVNERIVYSLTRALWHPNNRRALDNGHPYGRTIRRETAIEGAAIQLHSGAALYYFEAGLIR